MILNELSQDIHPIQANNLSTIMYPVDILIENAIEVRYIQESILDSMIDYQYTNVITESGTNIFKNIGKKIIAVIKKFINTIRNFVKAAIAKLSKTANINDKSDEELEKMIHDMHVSVDPKYKDKKVTYKAVSPDFDKDKMRSKLCDEIEINSYYNVVNELYSTIWTAITLSGREGWADVFHDSVMDKLNKAYESIESMSKAKPINADQNIDNINEFFTIDKSSEQEYTKTLAEAFAMVEKFKSNIKDTSIMIKYLPYNRYITEMDRYADDISELCDSEEILNAPKDVSSFALKLLKINLSIINDTVDRCIRISDHVLKISESNIAIYQSNIRKIRQAIIVAAKKR